ncbi:hypothetical protein KQI84_04265 [bacterium]|nr:hypothetical protein [bacterium]
MATNPDSRERLWAVFWVALTVVLAFGAVRARIDNSPATWTAPHTPAAELHRQTLDEFGPDEYVSFVRFDVDPFDSSQWQAQQQLADELTAVPSVARVDALPTLAQSLGPSAEKIPDPNLQETILDSRFARGTLLGRDGRSIRLFAWVSAGDSAARSKLLAEVRDLADRNGDWTIGGPVAFNVELDRLVQANMIRIGVYLAVAIVLLGFLIFRNLWGIVGLALSGLLPGAAWIGLCGWLGLSLNGAQLGALPFLAVIGLETFVHLWSESASERTHFAAAARKLSRPFFFAMITTAVSLLALAMAAFPFLRTIGWTLPMAVIVGWGFSRFALPRGMDWVRCSPQSEGPKLLQRLKIGRLPRALGIALTLLLLLAGGGALRFIQTEANIARQLPASSELAQTLSRIDQAFGGSLGLLVRIESPDGLAGDFEAERQIARELTPQGATVIGPAAWLDLQQAAHDDVSLLERMRQLAETPPEAAKAFIHGDATLVRVIIPQLPGKQIESIREQIEGDSPERRVTGTVANLMDVQLRILQEAARSFALSLLLVAVCIAFLLRSFATGLIALAVNLVPFAATVLLFAVTGWAVDMTNSQLFSMLFGFVVNSTVFMLASLAHPETVAHRSRAIVLAGVVGTILFSGLALTTLPSLQHFGMLAGVTIAAACFADVVLLPSLEKRRA